MCLRDEEEKASVWRKSAQGSGEPTVAGSGQETSFPDAAKSVPSAAFLFSARPEAFRGKPCVWSRPHPAAGIRPSPPGWAQPWVTVPALVAWPYESALAAVTKGHGPERLVDRNVNGISVLRDLGGPRPRCGRVVSSEASLLSYMWPSPPCVFVCPSDCLFLLGHLKY